MNRRFVFLPTLIAMGVALVTVNSCQRHMGKPNTAPSAPRPGASLSVTEKTPPAAQPKPADAKKPGKDAAGKPGGNAKPPVGGQAKRAVPGPVPMQGKMDLMRMVILISQIERTPDHALKPAQAKKMLAVLTPLRSKATLTDDEASKAASALKAVFTADQLEVLEKMQAMAAGQNRPGGQKPPENPNFKGKYGDLPSQRVEWKTVSKNPSGAPPKPPQGPPPPPGAGRPEQVRRLRDFNPFYAKVAEGDQRAARNAKHIDGFFDMLEKKAK